MHSNNRPYADSRSLTGWFKSTYSGGNNGDCLEAARGYASVPVRDSKAADGPAVVFSADGWSSFVTAVKSGRLGD